MENSGPFSPGLLGKVERFCEWMWPYLELEDDEFEVGPLSVPWHQAISEGLDIIHPPTGTVLRSADVYAIPWDRAPVGVLLKSKSSDLCVLPREGGMVEVAS